jgi:hypothetical protein
VIVRLGAIVSMTRLCFHLDGALLIIGFTATVIYEAQVVGYEVVVVAGSGAGAQTSSQPQLRA